MLKTILLLAVFVIVGVVVNSYLHPTPEAIRQAEIQHDLARMEMWHRIGQIFLPSAAALLLLGMAGGVRWIYRWSGRPTLIRAADGLYPVAVWDRSTPSDRLHGRRRVLAHDSNRATAATLSITAGRDGEIAVHSDIPDSRQADQIALAQSALVVQRTLAAASAARPRAESVAQMKERHGWYNNPPQPRSAPAQIVQPLALPAAAQPALSLSEAITRTSAAGDIVIGQQADGARALAVWRPADAYHVALLGSTGSGKSSNAGATILAGFIRAGGQGIVLEPEEAPQWGQFRPWAEWARVDGESVSSHTQAIFTEFQHRGAELARRGAMNLSDIPARERPPRLLVIFEEYSLLRGMAARAGTLEAFDRAICAMAATGGKLGIHLLLIAQHFVANDGTKWPKPVRVNCAARITYAQPENDTTKTLGGVYELGLLNRGEFAYRGKVYNSWHARPEVERILVNAPQRSGPGVLGGAGVRSVRSATSNPPTGGGTATNTHAEHSGEQAGEQGEWAEFARRFYGQNPDASQRALTRAMAGVDPEGRSAEAFVGGLSSALYHRYSPRGENYQSPAQAGEHGWVGGREIIDIGTHAGQDEIRRIDWRRVEVR